MYCFKVFDSSNDSLRKTPVKPLGISPRIPLRVFSRIIPEIPPKICLEMYFTMAESLLKQFLHGFHLEYLESIILLQTSQKISQVFL